MVHRAFAVITAFSEHCLLFAISSLNDRVALGRKNLQCCPSMVTFRNVDWFEHSLMLFHCYESSCCVVEFLHAVWLDWICVSCVLVVHGHLHFEALAFMQLFSEELFHPFQVREYSSKIHYYQIPIVEELLDSFAMQCDVFQSLLLHFVCVM